MTLSTRRRAAFWPPVGYGLINTPCASTDTLVAPRMVVIPSPSRIAVEPQKS
jgi:hypothetical protein